MRLRYQLRADARNAAEVEACRAAQGLQLAAAAAERCEIAGQEASAALKPTHVRGATAYVNRPRHSMVDRDRMLMTRIAANGALRVVLRGLLTAALVFITIVD